MLQDIEPYQFNNEFDIKKPEGKDYVLLFHNNQVALQEIEGGKLAIPTYATLQQRMPITDTQLTYLFVVDDVRFFLLDQIHNSLCEERGIQFHPLQIFRDFAPTWAGFAGITGSQLYRWYQSHQYCGRCGKPMKKSGVERAMVCESCGLTEYPKISPAVIVGIIDGNKILMTKYANRTFERYALIAGFVEIGETLEQTIHREVMEEVGLEVKNIRYYKNQPWAFSDSLLVGFFAELHGDKSITLDTDELAEAKWFDREEIPLDEENNISLTYTMMKAFREGTV